MDEQKYQLLISRKKAEVRKSIKRVPSNNLQYMSGRLYNKLKMLAHQNKTYYSLRKVFNKNTGGVK